MTFTAKIIQDHSNSKMPYRGEAVGLGGGAVVTARASNPKSVVYHLMQQLRQRGFHGTLKVVYGEAV